MRLTEMPASVPKPLKLMRNRMDPPPVHLRIINGLVSDKDRSSIPHKLGMKLGNFAASVERITVRLSDANGPKGGPDQRCQIKVVLRGLPSVVVNETGSTPLRAIDRAMNSIATAVRRTTRRRRLKPLHHRSSQATPFRLATHHRSSTDRDPS